MTVNTAEILEHAWINDAGHQPSPKLCFHVLLCTYLHVVRLFKHLPSCLHSFIRIHAYLHVICPLFLSLHVLKAVCCLYQDKIDQD